jgi:hypothetical protein
MGVVEHRTAATSQGGGDEHARAIYIDHIYSAPRSNSGDDRGLNGQLPAESQAIPKAFCA